MAMKEIKSLTRASTIQERWGFRKQWRSAHYHTGDLYQDDLQEEWRAAWAVNPAEVQPYLSYVKDISVEWPQLKLLADFMEVGTDPLRWKDFHDADKAHHYTYPDDVDGREKARKERVEKTLVTQLEYLAGGCKIREAGTYTTSEGLGHALDELSLARKPSAKSKDADNEKEADASCEEVALRLFVVEDLSRDVIERLGRRFQIDPDFWRAHAFDYAWFNIRDNTFEAPVLRADAQGQDWFQLRFFRARYFSNTRSFNSGQAKVNKFNISRKLYEDENKAFWDKDSAPKRVRAKEASSRMWQTISTPLSAGQRSPSPSDVEKQPKTAAKSTAPAAEPAKPRLQETIDGKVGLMRTKATFWQRKGGEGKCDVAVLLLDPTVQEGFPLWRGHRNWDPMPTQEEHGKRKQQEAKTAQKAGGSNNEQQSAAADAGQKCGDAGHRPAERTFFQDFVHWAQQPDVVLLNSAKRPTWGGGVPTETQPPPPLTTASGSNASDPRPSSTSSATQTPPLPCPSTTPVPLLALLRLVCAEWLTLSQYIRTRLSQVDWEVTHPDKFLPWDPEAAKIDAVLDKLHTWRRLVPVFRDMLAEARGSGAFADLAAALDGPLALSFLRGESTAAVGAAADDEAGDSVAGGGPVPARRTMMHNPHAGTTIISHRTSPDTFYARGGVGSRSNSSLLMGRLAAGGGGGGGVGTAGGAAVPGTGAGVGGGPGSNAGLTPLYAYRRELGLVLAAMEEYEARIDRLTAVVTSAISIVDSRRVETLTLLATLFVPLSLVGTLFSMSGDLTDIGATFGWWAIASFGLFIISVFWTRYTLTTVGKKK